MTSLGGQIQVSPPSSTALPRQLCPDDIEVQMAKAWGFDFPAIYIMLLRFDRVS